MIVYVIAATGDKSWFKEPPPPPPPVLTTKRGGGGVKSYSACLWVICYYRYTKYIYPWDYLGSRENVLL